MLTRTDPVAQERMFGFGRGNRVPWGLRAAPETGAPCHSHAVTAVPGEGIPDLRGEEARCVLGVFFLFCRQDTVPAVLFRPWGVIPLEIRKVFRAGNSLVISLPRAALAEMGLQEGSRVIVTVERDRRAIVIEPLQEDLLEIAREVIDEYRPFVAGGHAAGRPFSPTAPNGTGPAGA